MATLESDLTEVRESGRSRFVLIRGRRQVGKSRLAEEFIERHPNIASIFFTATKGRRPEAEIDEFVELASATLGDAAEFAGTTFTTWDAALGAVARAVTAPTVIVIDEFPYLSMLNGEIEGAFQKAWDRSLRNKPVLLIVIGSDLAMMAALTEYGRPLYGRPTREIVLPALNPAECAELAGVDAITAFDVYLMTGGFPNLVSDWPKGGSVRRFLKSRLTDSSSTIVIGGERILTAEFAPDSHARLILTEIGQGAATFGQIGQRAGIATASLHRAIHLLIDKGVVRADSPLAGEDRHESRYSIADPYLTFWLRFIERSIPLIDRGRVNDVIDQTLASWSQFRGKAIEPVIRESIARLLPLERAPEADRIGHFWTRTNSIEIDVVGTHGSNKRRRVALAGSITWRDRQPFEGTDAAALSRQVAQLPGADDSTVLLAVSATGFAVRDIPIQLGPDALLAAWTTSDAPSL